MPNLYPLTILVSHLAHTESENHCFVAALVPDQPNQRLHFSFLPTALQKYTRMGTIGLQALRNRKLFILYCVHVMCPTFQKKKYERHKMRLQALPAATLSCGRLIRGEHEMYDRFCLSSILGYLLTVEQ